MIHFSYRGVVKAKKIITKKNLNKKAYSGTELSKDYTQACIYREGEEREGKEEERGRRDGKERGRGRW